MTGLDQVFSPFRALGQAKQDNIEYLAGSDLVLAVVTGREVCKWLLITNTCDGSIGGSRIL